MYSVRGICTASAPHTLPNNPPFTSFDERLSLSSKLINKTQAETVIRAIPSEKSIYRTRHAHTNHDNRKKSDKTKLGCQTVGLGNNKPPTNSPASHESSNFISVTGDFQSTRTRSAFKKKQQTLLSTQTNGRPLGGFQDYFVVG